MKNKTLTFLLTIFSLLFYIFPLSYGISNLRVMIFLKNSNLIFPKDYIYT